METTGEEEPVRKRGKGMDSVSWTPEKDGLWITLFGAQLEKQHMVALRRNAALVKGLNVENQYISANLAPFDSCQNCVKLERRCDELLSMLNERTQLLQHVVKVYFKQAEGHRAHPRMITCSNCSPVLLHLVPAL
jgi:hypothetical protein